MPRNRSILIDADLGRAWADVTSVSTAPVSSKIFGANPLSKTLAQPTTSYVQVAKNIGGQVNGMTFNKAGGVITKLEFVVKTAPTGRSIIINVKKGLTYSGSVSIGVYSININSLSTQATVSFSYTASEALYFDVEQIGNVKPGTGLSITVSFYGE